jgi:hypothetical protein
LFDDDEESIKVLISDSASENEVSGDGFFTFVTLIDEVEAFGVNFETDKVVGFGVDFESSLHLFCNF